MREPFQTDAGETLVTYLRIDVAHRSPYDTLYKDYTVTIVMTKNCGYGSLKKWLSQQHMAPQGLAYPTSSNNLVEMMNSENFDPDSYKSKSKRNNRKNNKNKNQDDKEEEKAGAIVESTELIPDTPPANPTPTEQDSDSKTSSERDDSSEEDDEEVDIRRVFALVNSGHYEDDGIFDPESKKKKHHADYDEAINDTEIFGCVAAELLYEDDDYAHEDHTNPNFDECRSMWVRGGPMAHEKVELEFVYFTRSDMGANIQGYNSDAGMVRPEAAREETRRLTSNAQSNLTQDSLNVVVKRVRLLLGKPKEYVQSVIDIFGRIGIQCCLTLYSTLVDTRYDCTRSAAFTSRFEASSRGFVLCHKQLLFFRCFLMYMNERWEYDHKYFQRMIE